MPLLVRLLSRLKFPALLVERNKGIQQRASIIKYVRSTLCPHLRGMILKTDLEARRRGLCDLLHRIQLVTYGTLNPSVVIGDVAVFQKEHSTRCSASRALNSNNGATILSLKELRVPTLSCGKLTSRPRSTSLSTIREGMVPTRAQRSL